MGQWAAYEWRFEWEPFTFINILADSRNERTANGSWRDLHWMPTLWRLSKSSRARLLMIAQRAARRTGVRSYAQGKWNDNGWRGGIHSPIITPIVWMKTEKELLPFEQTLIYAPTRLWKVATSPESIYWKKFAMADYARIKEGKSEEFNSRFLRSNQCHWRYSSFIGHIGNDGSDQQLKKVREEIIFQTLISKFCLFTNLPSPHSLL